MRKGYAMKKTSKQGDKQIRHVLVTGGAGYVGSSLIPKLLDKGYEVTVYDLYLYGKGEVVFPAHVSHKKLHQVQGDLRNRALLKQSLTGVDAVIHLACISNDPSFELDPGLGKSINYDATIALIDDAKEVGVQRFIYASSSSVYGVKEEKEVTEELSLEPLTDYSKFKALCEPYLVEKGDDIFTPLVLRPATVCGYAPRLRLDLTVNILTLSALVKHKITVHGGQQERPNIHIEDMTDAYLFMLEQPKEKIFGKIYNVGFDNMKLIDIAKMVKKVIGDDSIEIEITPTNDLRSYRVSSNKVAKELGFVPNRTVEDAISDLVKAYRAGKITDAFHDNRFFNIKTMQQKQLK